MSDNLLKVNESEKYGASLVFACSGLPADDAVIAAGHEPNGHFWESVASYVAPDQAAALKFDCEADMFGAYGERAVVDQLRAALEPYVSDGVRVGELIARAETEGFVFDD